MGCKGIRGPLGASGGVMVHWGLAGSVSTQGPEGYRGHWAPRGCRAIRGIRGCRGSGVASGLGT